MRTTLTRVIPVLAAAALLVLALASAAGARQGHTRGDRNHDRIPDRWEHRYHLSLRVNQANRDQDRDGLRNRQEFLAGTDPREADSDNDGTEDGAEGAGKVTSLSGGKLTIALFNGDTVTAALDDRTELECEGAEDQSASTTARAASDGENEPGDDNGGDNQGDDDQGEDGQGDQQAGCDASLLTAGRVVQEAEAKATAGGLHWDEIKIVR